MDTIDIYGFDTETQHSNACTVDAVIAYEDPAMHSTVIIMINQAIKINHVTIILVCPMQYQVLGTVVNECHKFLSSLPSEDDYALFVHDPGICSPTLTVPLSLDNITSYFKAKCPSLL